jgi:DNA-binding CsgD family transcriptional regulator
MDWAAESGNLRRLVAVTAPIVRFWLERGLYSEVHRRLQEAIDAADAPDDVRLRGLLTAAFLAVGGNEFASAHGLASRAVEVARAADAGGALASALGLRAWSGAWSGWSTSEQVEADVEEAIHHAERGEDASTHALVLVHAGVALSSCHSIDAGCRLYEQAQGVCEANELVFQLPSTHAGLSTWLVWSGRLDRARSDARRGLELSREVARPAWEAFGLTGLGAAAVLQGDHDQAQEWLSEAQSVLQGHGLEGTLYDMSFREWVALSAYASGDLEPARAAAGSKVRIGRGGGSRWDEARGQWLLGVVAQVEGRHDDARAHLEASRTLSTDPRMPFPLGRSFLGVAQLAEQDDDLDEAWELAHDSLEVLDGYGDRVGAAAALETIAELAGAMGEPERSLRLLAATERFHTESGIARFPLEADRFGRARDAAHAALDDPDATVCWEAGSQLSLEDAVAYARRGRGERQRPQIGWASLTPTEKEVVRLVAAGHTNAEIGKRLFVSVHTVKKHLSHVYAKVGLGSRAELVAEVARRER